MQAARRSPTVAVHTIMDRAPDAQGRAVASRKAVTPQFDRGNALFADRPYGDPDTW